MKFPYSSKAYLFLAACILLPLLLAVWNVRSPGAGQWAPLVGVCVVVILLYVAHKFDRSGRFYGLRHMHSEAKAIIRSSQCIRTERNYASFNTCGNRIGVGPSPRNENAQCGRHSYSHQLEPMVIFARPTANGPLCRCDYWIDWRYRADHVRDTML